VVEGDQVHTRPENRAEGAGIERFIFDMQDFADQDALRVPTS
jgi:hypothetical protein